jgi:predicted permease
MNDLKFAFRQLLKNPGFTAIGVLTLALGIGANTSIFGVVNELMFRPKAVQEPDALRAILFRSQNGGLTLPQIPRPFYRIYREQNHGFSDLIGYAPIHPRLEWEGQRQRIDAELVSGNYFAALGVKAALGRGLLPDDDTAAADGQPGVISQACWRKRFNADPAIVGKTILVNGLKITVVGIAPRNFRGLGSDAPDLWLPMELEPLLKEHAAYQMVGRLPRGGTEAGALANIGAITRFLNETYRSKGPPGYEQYGAFADGLSPSLLPAARGSLNLLVPRERIWKTYWLFMGAVALVLLIACANVASLLLVRAVRRRKEIALRLALGASRMRLVRQLLIESLLLGLLGGATGLLVAVWLNELLVAWKPPHLFLVADFTLDPRVLGFAFLVSLGTGLLFGLAPAWQASRQDLNAVLKDEGRNTSSRAGFSLRNALVTGQLAVCFVLLIGAGLCLRSFGKLLSIEPGFDTAHLLVLPLDLEAAGYTDRTTQIQLPQLLERISALPQVKSAAFAQSHPLSGGASVWNLNELEGYERTGDARIKFEVTSVGPDYFRVMGIGLLQGRELAARDPEPGESAVVNESFVRRYWPNQAVIGKRVSGRPVIGVVPDSRVTDLSAQASPHVYLQASRANSLMLYLLVNTRSAPLSALPALRADLQSFNRQIDLGGAKTMDQILLRSLSRQRFTLLLLGAFAFVALLLAAIGTYGVMSYTVSERTQEIGIRMALGARRWSVIQMIMARGGRLAVSGVALGLIGSFALTRALTGQLYEISATDPATFAGVSVLLLGIALAACYLPARRATRVEPMTALRRE